MNSRSSKPDFAAIGWQYARDIVSGDIPSCVWTRKACARSLRDLDRSCTVEFPFRFDSERAARVCTFVQLLPHVKGATGLIRLEPWQCWVLTQAFGWLHDRGDREGLRRFRTSHLELGRGNGKSCLTSAVALYMLAADGEMGAEVYSAATTRDQARIVLTDAQAMARSPQARRLTQALGIDVHAHSVTVTKKNSRFTALSAQANSLDGLNILFAAVDELHAHSTREVWDVIVTGAGKRPQSLIWAITTAGTDRSGICYEQRTYLTKLLDQTAHDESMFGCIWCSDDGDDWQSETAWRKANPNWGVSVEPSYVAGLAKRADVMPAAINNFKTKHLCEWVNADQAWADMRAWDRARDGDLTLADFAGEPCYIGLDLAAKTDICAKTYLFTRKMGDAQHFYVFGQYYLPQRAVDDGRNSQYSGWQAEGRLTVTPGDVLDFDRVESDLLDDRGRFDVKSIGYDPWQAAQLAQRLIEQDLPMVEVRNTVANFSAPMKEIDAVCRAGRLHHDDPVLVWMVGNVVCHTDAKDNIFPRKQRPENKIDGVVALITAMARCMADMEQVSVYESRGFLFI